MTTRYIRTSASAGGNGTTDTDSGGNHAYNSLAAFDAGEAGTLSAPMEALCSVGSGSAANTSGTLIGSDWITSSTNHLTIKPNTGDVHSGQWDATIFRISFSTNYQAALEVKTEYSYITGLQIETTGNFSTCVKSTIGGSSEYIHVQKCILKGSGSGTSGISLFGYNNRFLINNLIYDRNKGIHDVNPGKKTVVYANTIVDCSAYGIHVDVNAARSYYKNNLIDNSTTGDWQLDATPNPTSADNATSDATSPDTPHRNSTFTFTDSASDDFSLSSSDTGALDLGTDLSSDAEINVTEDITGATRTGTWDIGAFMASAAAGGIGAKNLMMLGVGL